MKWERKQVLETESLQANTEITLTQRLEDAEKRSAAFNAEAKKAKHTTEATDGDAEPGSELLVPKPTTPKKKERIVEMG